VLATRSPPDSWARRRARSLPFMRAAILDLGSNSFHILVAEAGPDGSITPILREREMLHLGAIVAEHGHVPQVHADAAVRTVAHFAELARRTGADPVVPVATAALREATNGPTVVAALSEAAGVPVRVIDGRTEARLSYKGVRSSVATSAEPILVIDLGGGSLELAVGCGDDVQWSVSLPIGVGRMAIEAVHNDPPTWQDLARVRAAVDAALLPVWEELKAHDVGDVIAVGGTVRSLARVIATGLSDWSPASLNMFKIPAVEIGQWAERLATMTLDERLAVDGMKDTRADHLHVAALIIATVLDRLAVAEVTVSDWGMREGVLREAFGLSAPATGEELREQAVQRLRNLFTTHDPHLDHVAALAVRLFDDTRALHGLGDEERALLHHASILHDLGESIALRGHHKHSSYLIEHSEIRGFSPGDLGVLCTLARFHQSRRIKTKFPAYASLGADRRHAVDRLLPLLQLADGLDRARDQAVRDVTARCTGDAVELELHGSDLHTSHDEVLRKTGLFERTYGLPIRLVDLDANGSGAGAGAGTAP
jgi:exopolyphosphatase/guanosine-5'-triphosphate,3'-diphosphate pyrophosphatase